MGNVCLLAVREKTLLTNTVGYLCAENMWLTNAIESIRVTMKHNFLK